MLTKMHIVQRREFYLSPVENPVENVENLGLSTAILQIYPEHTQGHSSE